MNDPLPPFRSEVTEDVLVLTLAMETLRDYEAARALNLAFESAYAAAGVPHVVVDMSQLTFLTSVGIWPLLGLRHKTKESGGKLVLCNITDFVYEVLRRTQLLVNPKATTAPFLNAKTVAEGVLLARQA